jgi:predicted outer membrane repeat protein
MSRCLFLLFLIASSTTLANIYTVGAPGTPGACTHTSIQAALNAAAAHAGEDEVRISNTQTYGAQALVINDSAPLLLQGGFADCLPFAPVERTTISGLGGSAAPVLRTADTATVDVTLRGLEIRDGDAVDYGGGILHAAKGKVSIVDGALRHNQAVYGGAIAMHLSPGQTAGTREVVVGPGVVVGDTDVGQANHATSLGGGIYLDVGTLTFLGSGSSVLGNRAGSGGGVALIGNSENVRADFGSGGDGNRAVLEGNSASSYGGAIYAGGSTAKVRLFTTEAQNPLRVNGNSAQYGGAFAVSAGASLSAWQTQVTGNTASVSGGVVRLNDGATLSLGNNLGLGGPPATAVACAAGLRCNLIAGNGAGVGAGIATVIVQSSGLNTQLTLESATVRGNSGNALFTDFCQLGGGACGHTFLLAGSEISGNSAASIASFVARPQLTLEQCSVAGNDGSDALFYGASLLLSRSIVWQPGRAVFDAAGLGGMLAATHVITHDSTGFPTNYTIRSADPRFVDAGNGDYRLRGDSPALDSAPTGGSMYASLDGGAREVDLAEVPNYFGGSSDLGAYERRYYCAADTVFCHGFDPARN